MAHSTQHFLSNNRKHAPGLMPGRASSIARPSIWKLQTGIFWFFFCKKELLDFISPDLVTTRHAARYRL
jgi:hypothetical protein